MALALCNAQGELHPLEVGLHALHSGLSVRDYAQRVGLAHPSIVVRRHAGEVVTRVIIGITPDRWRHLAEIHASLQWLWPALV
jgi:hypothetical protein